jgi:hypothetical protein
MVKSRILTAVVLFAWFATVLSGALQLLKPLPGATYYILPGLRTATIPVIYLLGGLLPGGFFPYW